MDDDEQFLKDLSNEINERWTKNYVERQTYMAQKRKPKIKDTYEMDEFLAGVSDIDLMVHMGVPEDMIGYEPRPLDPDIRGWLQNLRYCHRPTREDHLAQPNLYGSGLIFYGPSGTEKSVTAANLLLQLIRLNIRNTDPDLVSLMNHQMSMGAFLEWPQVLDLLRADATSDLLDDETEHTKRLLYGGGTGLKRGNFLVLDDIGRDRATDFAVSEFQRYLRYRHSHGWATILTVNHPPRQWKSIFGPVLAAYLQRSYMPIEFIDYLNR